jgi:hypothetical protein
MTFSNYAVGNATGGNAPRIGASCTAIRRRNQ